MTTKELSPQLDVIIAAKRQYLQERKTMTPIDAVRALASMQKRPQAVLKAIAPNEPIMLIGQVSYKIPKTGPLNEGYDPVGTAMRFIHIGADAVALFTDNTLYQKGLDDLVLVSRAVSIPVISQDFILEEYQIVEARAAGASALVLYSDILQPSALRSLVSATQRNRMTAIVEVRNREQLEYALSLSPYAIGLSRYDLNTRQMSDTPLEFLRATIPPNIRVIVIDALKTLDEVRAAAYMRVDAIVVDQTLLDDPDQLANLQTILRRT